MKCRGRWCLLPDHWISFLHGESWFRIFQQNRGAKRLSAVKLSLPVENVLRSPWLLKLPQPVLVLYELSPSSGVPSWMLIPRWQNAQYHEIPKSSRSPFLGRLTPLGKTPAKFILTEPVSETFGASLGSVAIVLETAGMNLSYDGVPAPENLNPSVAVSNLKNCPHKSGRIVSSLLWGFLSARFFASSSRSGFVAMMMSQLLAPRAL